jgi:hypothetical protein
VLRDVFDGVNHTVVVGQDSGTGAAAWYFAKQGGGPWTRARVLGAGGDQSLISVTGGPDRFVAVGYSKGDNGVDAAVWTSVNGEVWERTSMRTLLRDGDQRMRGVAYVPDAGFVAVGLDEGRAAVWTSKDGLQWTLSEKAVRPNADQGMTGILAVRNRLIAVGKDKGLPAVWIAQLKGS